MEEVFSTPDLLNLLYQRGAPKELGQTAKSIQLTNEESAKARLREEFGIIVPEHLVTSGIHQMLYNLLEPHRYDPSIYQTLWITGLDPNDDKIHRIPKILFFNRKVRLSDELIRQGLQANDQSLTSMMLEALQGSDIPIRISDETLTVAISKCDIDTTLVLLEYNLANFLYPVTSSGPLIAIVENCSTSSLLEYLINFGRFYQGALEAAIDQKKYEAIRLLAATGKIGTNEELLDATKKGDRATVEALLVDSTIFPTNALIIAAQNRDVNLVNLFLDDGRVDLTNSKLADVISGSRSSHIKKLIDEEKSIREWDLKAIDRLSSGTINKILDRLAEQEVIPSTNDLKDPYHLKLWVADIFADLGILEGGVEVLENEFFRKNYLLTNEELVDMLNDLDVPKIPNTGHFAAAMLLSYEMDPDRSNYLMQEILYGASIDSQYWLRLHYPNDQ